MNIMHIFKKDQVGDVLQRLYNTNFIFTIESDPGGGFRHFIPQLRGIPFDSLEMKTDPTSISDTVSVVAFKVAMTWPESEFATWYKSIEQ